MCTCRLFVCDKSSWQRAALSDDFNIKAFPLRLIWSCSWNSALLRQQTGFRKLANLARSPETSEDDANAQPECCCRGSLRRDSLMWFPLLMGSPQVRYWLLNGPARNGSPPSSSRASIFQGLWALVGGHGHMLLKATGGQIKDSAAGKKTLKIQQLATESQDSRALLSGGGWWTRLLEDVCWSRCIGVWGRSKTEHRGGVSAIQNARSVRDLARHQTRRCLQVNWKKKGIGETVQSSVCQETKRLAQDKGGFGKLNRCEYTGGHQTGKNYSEILWTNWRILPRKPDASERHEDGGENTQT